MALASLWNDKILLLSLGAVAVLLALTALLSYLFRRPAFPSNAPTRIPSSWPILGNPEFFTERWDFCKRFTSLSQTGDFSFYAGQHPIVSLSSDAGRRVFFEHKGLGFSEGYATLLGGSPTVKENNNVLAQDRATDSEYSSYFSKRLIAMLKGNKLVEILPLLIQDGKGMFEDLLAEGTGLTDPFDSFYRMVFKFTMRAVACREIAEDDALLAKTLHAFEEIEASATPMAIMYPWMASWAQLKRLYYGSQLYLVFKKVIDDRTKEGRRENDALQFLLDQGDSTVDVITFVLGALFAGQLNSGINTAWMLLYFAHKPYWQHKVREEVIAAVDRHSPDTTLPLQDRLSAIPIEAWESDFPLIDLCLKDSIRLQLHGTAFRKNISGQDIPLSKGSNEVLPKDAYALYATGHVHLNPDIYPNPHEWDPARYLPERAEDKKQPYAWIGWGVSRHPCLGMRFAKLEMSVFIALAVAYLDDLQLADSNGNVITTLPRNDTNGHTAHKPAEKVFLKFRPVAQKA